MDHTIIAKKVTIPVEGIGDTSGIIFMPEGSTLKKGVIVAHGAGNNMHTPLLAAFSTGIAGAGYPLLRFNFLYSEQGKKAPDRPEVLVKTWLAAFRSALIAL